MRFSKSNTEFLWARNNTDTSKEQGGKTSPISIRTYFFLIDFYWNIIASQYCVNFCCTTKRISNMHTHFPISLPSRASLPFSLYHSTRPSHITGLISLCYTAAFHQPTILHSVAYICRCYSHFFPASPSHPMSSSPFSTSTSLFL